MMKRANFLQFTLCAGVLAVASPGCDHSHPHEHPHEHHHHEDGGVASGDNDTSLDAGEAPDAEDTSTTEDSGGSDATGQGDLGVDTDGPLDDELKAFPGAVGFGRHATGGRGGRVVYVTNLDDSGPGSLRDALEMTGPRTIIFRVGGTIEATDYLSIGSDNGDVTIAGQTAPGDGIAIKGAELRIQSSNTIVRYLRVRPGDGTTGSNEDGVRVVSYSGRLVEDVIIDHTSVTWAKDELVSFGGIGDGSRVSDVTIQNSIIGENIDTQYGLLLWRRATNVTVYGNLFVHNKERSIRASTCSNSFEMINNVVYGFTAATRPTYENVFSVIGNVYSTNPGIDDRFETIRLEASTNNCPDGQIDQTQAYVVDNSLDGGAATISSNLTGRLLGAAAIDSQVAALPVEQVFDHVLADVGANLPASDAVDRRLIDETRQRTGGYPSSVAEAGGYPDLAGGEPYPDADKDGMDDNWERSKGLDPQDGADGAEDRNGDGYTNLDEFLHHLTVNR
jgi:hypothetical protein